MAHCISLCLGSYYVFDPLADEKERERDYAEILKPLLSLMCANPSLVFSLYLSGEAIEWITRCHPEFFSIAVELVSKRSLEFVGGGFFAPYLPFIPAGDRVIQVEMLTTALRRKTGKKPRGAWLPESAWDSSIIPALASCGIEYVFIDKDLLCPSCTEDISPVSVEENGKVIVAIPLKTLAATKSLEMEYSPENFLQFLFKLKGDSSSAALAFFIKPEAMPSALLGEEPWLVRILRLASNEPIFFGSAYQIAKGERASRKWIILPSGISQDEDSNSSKLSRVAAKQGIINSSALMFELYTKMIYVHTLVNQVRGDKARKALAREELCRAENYLHFSRKDLKKASASASYVYKRLLCAEKLARQRGVFSDSLVAFDYDFDGQKEYLSQSEPTNMYLHSLGGKIFKCDIFSAAKNFCSSIGKEPASSGKGFFLDYFLSEEQADAISESGIEALPELFSSNFYQEDFVNISKREVALKTKAFFGNQALTLKKRFLFQKLSLQVQFILKNESKENLSGVFATALNFVLSNPKKTAPEVSVFSCEKKLTAPKGVSEYPQAEWILISDSDGGVEFKIDANENPTVALSFLEEKRESKELLFECGQTLSVLLYWNTDLRPGYETEKTVFLTIMS